MKNENVLTQDPAYYIDFSITIFVALWNVQAFMSPRGQH